MKTVLKSVLCIGAVLCVVLPVRGGDRPGVGKAEAAFGGLWKAGTARILITPQESMWMAGYSARDKPAVGKLQDLYAKALVMEDPAGERLVLVTTDLVGLHAKLTNAVAIGKAHELVGQVRSISQKDPAPKLRVVVIGAHPDDPESGCGGLIALLTRAGHEVIVAYTTCFRGDRKIGEEPEGTVRRREATAACQLLKAKPHFFDYAHEKLLADAATLDTVSAWLRKVQPDIVVTHWPLDTHPNHHVTSSLVWQSYLREGTWSLYFFEVETDQQTMSFQPDLYLDIGSVRELKRKALGCHRSQGPENIWEIHDAMHRRRGAECGVKYAEAYLRASPEKGRAKLPVSFLEQKKGERREGNH